MKEPPHPAKWINTLLRRVCKPDLLEEIEGDLFEYYELWVTQHGKVKANRLYVLHTIKFLRPFAIKKLNSNNSNFSTMFQHTLLISLRNFTRYKTSFLINLLGLSTGLSCVFLIYLWVDDELNVDKFHEKDSQLYQVMQNYPTDNGIQTTEGTQGLLAQTLDQEIPEVEFSSSVYPSNINEANWCKGTLSLVREDKGILAGSQFVSRDFFNVFSYDFIHGDGRTALNQNEIYISAELALKLFETTKNVIGRNVEWENEVFGGQYIVSGIFSTTFSSSTRQPDLLFSYEHYLKKNDWLLDWGSYAPSTFVILKKGAGVEQFNTKIKDFVKSKSQYTSGNTLFAQQYSEKYLYGQYKNGVPVGGRIIYVRLFSFIALIVLAIACINFMNLSTAKVSRRTKEVGIKKAMGARRKTLIFQFLGESMLMTIFSLIIAIALVMVLLPHFGEITGKQLTFDTSIISAMLSVTILTGLISGSYPALYLSNFSPILVLKGKLKTTFGELWIRKGLVIFQFTISIILIASVLVIYKQLQFTQVKNLGYQRDNVISFKIKNRLQENVETFLSEIKRISGVVNTSYMWGDLTSGANTRFHRFTQGQTLEEKRILFHYYGVGYDWVESLGIEVKEGRSFSRNFGLEREKIIFNETAIDVMGLKDPIGKTVGFSGGNVQIIGVVKNFHFESLYEEVKPAYLIIDKAHPDGNIIVRIKAGTEKATIAQLERLYQELSSGSYPFTFNFLDQDYQTQYVAEQRVAVLSKYFAGIALVISSLGLFGLAAFTAERRIKEIGIRKILGSGVWGIIRLLTGDFNKMVLAAITIALPLSYIISKNWLDDFAYRIDLKWWFFVGTGAFALLIAWLTIGFQTFKAANINPSECLRNE